MRPIKSLTALALGALLVFAAGAAHAYTGEEYAKQARLSLAQARTMALMKFPGTVLEQELSKQSGGSGLRYSFDIQNGGGEIREIGIDAKTGKLLKDAKATDTAPAQ